VQWFKMKSDVVDPEKKTVKTKTGDLASSQTSGSDGNFNNGPKEFKVFNTPDAYYGQYSSRIDEGALRKNLDDKNIYQVKFKNIGGLVTPLVIEWTFKDGSKEIETLPAEVWRINEYEVTRIFVKEKEVVNIVLDPKFELADVEMSNNTFPRQKTESKFDELKK
jgi:hypothetical protein